MNPPAAAVRLQKLLASAGIGSRRQIEQWIREGRLMVDGRPASLGERAGPQADIRLDGRKLELARQSADGAEEAILYYKPVGEVTTRRDPQGRPTVFDRLPAPARGRWIVVGRLDVNTAGLLLFTTDGAMAHGLMHPSRQIEREYLVRVRGRPSAATLLRLRQGLTLEDGPAAFDRIIEEQAPKPAPQLGGPSHAAFRVVLHEGRNREVRRLWQAAGHEVSRLLRIRYGPVSLPRDLRPGDWRRLDAAVLAELTAAAVPPASS
ncbi:MAG: pseudouridine synthase [Steroidobacteraceae bacterium]